MSRLPQGRAVGPLRVDRASPEYRKAFEAYLRYGTPIDLRTRLEAKAKSKDDRPTTHYIWRTQGDNKVRASHAANDGKIFAWDDPPPTGHPGEDYGCRCWAEPYAPDTDESFTITLQNVSDEGAPWASEDFVRHYFLGEGRAVTVRQTGHLKAVVAEFRRKAGDVPTRLPGQIADAARLEPGSSFNGDFGRPYPMKDVAFSLGNTTIEGVFRGKIKRSHALLELRGTINFELKDEFRDPLGLGTIGSPYTEIPFGKPYLITDRWGGSFSATVLIDGDKSKFKYVEP